MSATASPRFAVSAPGWSAVEPQPALALHAHACSTAATPTSSIERVAVGRTAGDVELMVNTDNPTVSTASRCFIHAAQDAPGWQGQHWDKSIRVPMTTLDALIDAARHAGVHQDRRRGLRGRGADGADAAGRGAVVRIHHHPARHRARLHRPLRGAWIDAVQCRDWAKARSSATGARQRRIGRWLDELPHEANSGDIYALRP